MDRLVIEGVELTLTHPDEVPARWVGENDLPRQLAAAWLVVSDEDIPLNPRIIGKPGVGKTTLACAVAQGLGKDVYIVQATMDTRPEDLLITPVITSESRISYHASGLVTAMLKGGVCVLDEGNRMTEKSWASLAPLLDHRRYVESIIAGIKIKAHPDFRFVCTMNDDASTYEVPEYIQSRLQPVIAIPFPDYEQEKAILKFNVPYAEEEILEMTVRYLQRSHERGQPFTARDGINVLRYSMKLAREAGGSPKDWFRPATRQIFDESRSQEYDGFD